LILFSVAFIFKFVLIILKDLFESLLLHLFDVVLFVSQEPLIFLFLLRIRLPVELRIQCLQALIALFFDSSRLLSYVDPLALKGRPAFLLISLSRSSSPIDNLYFHSITRQFPNTLLFLSVEIVMPLI